MSANLLQTRKIEKSIPIEKSDTGFLKIFLPYTKNYETTRKMG